MHKCKIFKTYNQLSKIMHARDTIFQIQQRIITTKAHEKFQSNQFQPKRFFRKDVIVKNAYIMHSLCLIMHATDTIFIDWVCITLLKLPEKFQPDPLKIYLTKVEKEKNA